MQKYLPLLTLVALLFSCNQKAKIDTTKFTDVAIVDSNAKPIVADTTKADSTKNLLQALAVDTIFAGKSIAQLLLAQTFDEAMQIQGEPTKVDTSKKTLILQWQNKSIDTSQYFTTATFEPTKTSKKIKQIITTNPNFKTPEQVGVGSTLAFIKVQYPTLKKATQTYTNKAGVEVTVYDEIKEGIAFEINDADKCTLVSIHVKGQKYIPVSL